MEDTRQVAKQLAREGKIAILQKGIELDPDKVFKGPIRLRLKVGEVDNPDIEGKSRAEKPKQEVCDPSRTQKLKACTRYNRF